MKTVISILVILFSFYLIGIMLRSLVRKTKDGLEDIRRPGFQKIWQPIIDFEKSFQFYSLGVIFLIGVSAGIFVVSLLGKNDFRTVMFIISVVLLSTAIGQNLTIEFFVKNHVNFFSRNDDALGLMIICVVFGCLALLGFIKSYQVPFVW